MDSIKRAKISVGNLFSVGHITRDEAINRLVQAGMTEADAKAYMDENFPI